MKIGVFAKTRRAIGPVPGCAASRQRRNLSRSIKLNSPER